MDASDSNLLALLAVFRDAGVLHAAVRQLPGEHTVLKEEGDALVARARATVLRALRTLQLPPKGRERKRKRSMSSDTDGRSGDDTSPPKKKQKKQRYPEEQCRRMDELFEQGVPTGDVVELITAEFPNMPRTYCAVAQYRHKRKLLLQAQATPALPSASPSALVLPLIPSEVLALPPQPQEDSPVPQGSE